MTPALTFVHSLAKQWRYWNNRCTLLNWPLFPLTLAEFIDSLIHTFQTDHWRAHIISLDLPLRALNFSWQNVGFFCKQLVFSAQPQCCLTFLWLEFQMLLRCCLIDINIIILRHLIFTIFVSMSRPRSIYVVSMWSSLWIII